MNVDLQAAKELAADMDKYFGRETRGAKTILALVAEVEHMDGLFQRTHHCHWSWVDKCDRLKRELESLKRGEYICQKCGLRKDAEFEKGDF